MPGKYGPYDIFEQVCDEISNAELECSEDISQYEQALVDEEEINEIVDEFDKIYGLFISGLDWGRADNWKAWRKRIKEIINAKSEKYFNKEILKVKDSGGYRYLACSGRVRQLGELFIDYLSKKGFESDLPTGMDFNLEVNFVTLQKGKLFITIRAPETTFHTWIEVDYANLDINGNMEFTTIKYDAWYLQPPKLLTS